MARSLAWLSDRRTIIIMAVALFALAMLYFNGPHFGIEFTGGTRLPIILEKPVSKTTMEEVVNTIKIRTTKFGLTQVIVRSVGDQRIDVEVSQSDPTFINDIQNILKSEGKFEGIIDGRVAVTGSDIISGSIREDPVIQGNDVRWGVSFIITQDGAKRFGNAAFGKANYPVNLFLDRSEDTGILIREKEYYNENVTNAEQDEAVKSVLNFSKNVVILIDDNATERILESNKSRFIVESNETKIIAFLKEKNFTVVEHTLQEIKPKVTKSNSQTIVEEWNAIGLLSAPALSPNLATGTAGQQYRIEGAAPGSTYDERRESAAAEMKKLRSILSGGALPVRIELGSTITVPPSLGKEFLNYSVIGIIAAAIAVSLVVLIRYKSITHVMPLIFVATTQMIILISILAVFGTLDLATIAGIFGALGTSVDAQMVVSDELLNRKIESKDEAKRRLSKAFYINTRSSMVLLLVLLPLLFSSIVEIIGFVTATVLGSIIGVTLTIQTYSAVIDKQEI